MLNPIEPPWYVTRMPGGVTGTARESLPMSINDASIPSHRICMEDNVQLQGERIG